MCTALHALFLSFPRRLLPLIHHLRSVYSLYPFLGGQSTTVIPAMPALLLGKKALPNILPAELWLAIFESLPMDSLRSVIFACHFFRWLAQPLLFHTLCTRTSTVTFDSYGRPTSYQLAPPVAEKTVAQVEFYSSDRIASSVNTVIIKPISIVETFLARHTRGIKDDGAMQRRVFRALGDFPNLTTLHLCDLTLTDADLVTLKSISALSSVTLDACDTSSKFPPALPVKSLSIECRRASAEGALKRLWSAFLQPSALHELSIGPWSVVDNDVILSALLSAGPWPHLRTFKIGYGATEAEEFLDFLSQVPNLEELYFHAEDVIPLSSLPSQLVPNLRSYVGPVDTAHGVLQSRKELRHLQVFGSGNVNIIDSHILLDRLKGLGELSGQLWSLQFEAHQLTKAVFKLISERFTQLKALKIYAERVGDVDDRTKSLADWFIELPLSPSIEYISVTTLQEEPGADTISKERHILPVLRKRYKRLSYFHYSISSYVVRWDCVTGRRIKEEMSKDVWMGQQDRVGAQTQ